MAGSGESGRRMYSVDVRLLGSLIIFDAKVREEQNGMNTKLKKRLNRERRKRRKRDHCVVK
jgi:hypothetical protein